MVKISLVPDEVISGGALDLLGIGTENSFYICDDTPVGTYHIIMQATDGVGGKKTMPLQLDVSDVQVVEGGDIEWRDCGNVYCHFVDSKFYYHYALTPEQEKAIHTICLMTSLAFQVQGGLSNADFCYMIDGSNLRVYSLLTPKLQRYIFRWI